MLSARCASQFVGMIFQTRSKTIMKFCINIITIFPILIQYFIEAMENFFRSVEMPTSLHELGLDLTDQQIHDLAFKCSFKDTRTIGVFKQLNMRDMEKIYLMAR